MLISKKWLSEFIHLPDDVSDASLAQTLTNAVVEVESVSDQAAAFDRMVVGRVVSVLPHPNADRLRLCQVDVGDRQVQVVCGGTNVVPDMDVVVALPGARVRWHGEGDVIELVKTEIRGQESEGMICAGSEIGLGKPTDQDHEIMDISDLNAKAGTPIAQVFGFDDVVFDIEHKSMTNRPDLFGHYGFAREVAALYQLDLASFQTKKIHSGKSIRLSVDVEDPMLCPRYMAVAMDGVVVGPSPDWMQKRLRSCGLNSINNVVDVTNYVLLELGQPMHAFDADTIGGDDIFLEVRCAQDGESLLALDDKTYALGKDRLLIANKTSPLALAGVMGGKESGVSESTTRIVFESANFSASSVRKTSQMLGLRSESSARFEKSLDPNMCEIALARAVELLSGLCPGAHPASVVIDEYRQKPKTTVVELSADWVNERLGSHIESSDIKNILERLGCKVSSKGQMFSVQVPSWRATKDISIREDLLEEIVRLHGYNLIESALPSFTIQPPVVDPVRSLVRQISGALVHHGATEVYAYAFSSASTLSALGWNEQNLLKLANPLSEERPYIVSSLVPNLLECVRKNQRMEDEVCVFESDRVFLPNTEGEATGEDGLFLPSQPMHLAFGYMKKGNAEPFWNAKTLVESVLHSLGHKAVFVDHEKKEAWQHKTRSAQILVHETVIGVLAEVDPLKAEGFGLDERVAVVELDITELADVASGEQRYKPAFVYPSVVRDVAFVVNDTVSYTHIASALSTSSMLLQQVDLFDVYRGKGVENGKKSMAIHLTFQREDKTLEAKEVETEMQNIQKMLVSQFGVILRT